MDCAAGMALVGNRSETGPKRIRQPVPVPEDLVYPPHADLGDIFKEVSEQFNPVLGGQPRILIDQEVPTTGILGEIHLGLFGPFFVIPECNGAHHIPGDKMHRDESTPQNPQRISPPAHTHDVYHSELQKQTITQH